MTILYRGACYERDSDGTRVWRRISDHTAGRPHDWTVASTDTDRIRETIDREHDFGIGGPNGIGIDADVTLMTAPTT